MTMRILLTNDDGYDAPGLRALYEAVSGLPSVAIDVIAPSMAQSGKGHTVSGRFRFWRAGLDGIGQVWVVDGSPPDCVRAAGVLPGSERPDWVVSGINRGSNLGVDIYNSGTVAAAREAAILGIPSLAVSYLVKASLEDDWRQASREAAAVIACLLMPDAPCPPHADPLVHGQMLDALGRDFAAAESRSVPASWNVNLPRLPAGQPALRQLLREPGQLSQPSGRPRHRRGRHVLGLDLHKPIGVLRMWLNQAAANGRQQ
jgi:hypothetical protein